MEGLPVASMFGRRLNTPERECFSLCFESDTNLVISVSTGSEKSGLFELCMMRNFSKFTDGKLIHMNGASKTIYVAPRNLVEQKLLDWGNKYGRLGVKCLQLKGENENYNSNLHDADVILTTSEEFDAITRSLTNDDRLSFFGKIALVLLDEVHLLSEPSGAALEAIVSRMKMWRKFMISEPEMISSPLCSVRFMAISAPIPNIHDLAEWLMVPEKGIKSFGEESGHVKQTTKVSGCTPAENDILFEKGHLDEIHLNGCVESQLLPCLREYITAEIVQLSIPDLTRAIEWLKCSFLYVRMKKNPKIYSVMTGLDLEEHTKDICVQTIEELSLRNMIRTAEDGILLEPCELGKLMTKYNLKFNTMKHIMETPVTSIKDALRSVCYAEEISGGKKCIQTREEIFILANDCLTGDSKLQKTISKGEQVESICSDGCRVEKCMKEYFVQQKVYKGALNSALLAKTLHLKLRDNSPYLLEQLPDIDTVTAKALEVEMRLEVNEQGKLGVTLTRLSQSTASTKQHYADMMISMEEEDKILFHERIRWDDFSSPPYCTTVHLPDTEPEKFTVNADLVFEEFIGDIHQTMTVAKIPSRYNIKIKGLQDILAMDEPLRLTRDRDKLKQNEELEHFVLVWIADSLSVEDFRAFREVCTSWQDAASRNNFASKTPLLMLAEKEDDSNVREFYSIFEHKICTSIAIPEAHGKRCTEVGFGWILALSPSGEMSLLSLFSTRKIGNLPNFPEVYSSARGILTADPCSASSFYSCLLHV